MLNTFTVFAVLATFDETEFQQWQEEQEEIERSKPQTVDITEHTDHTDHTDETTHFNDCDYLDTHYNYAHDDTISHTNYSCGFDGWSFHCDIPIHYNIPHNNDYYDLPIHADEPQHNDIPGETINEGFDHVNYIPSKPVFYNTVEDNKTINGIIIIGLYSYDKNADGYGTQDAVSKTVKYNLKIRKIKNLDGTDDISPWRTLLNNSIEDTYELNTVDPLGTGNTDPRAAEGYYELQAYSINDTISQNGVTKEYVSPAQTVTVKIKQNVEPDITVENGDEFINFYFGLEGAASPEGIFNSYIDGLYADAKENQKEGIFVKISLHDKNSNQYHKGKVYLEAGGVTVPGTEVDITWESVFTDSEGINRIGAAFIPKEYYLDDGALENVYVVVDVKDYLDQACTEEAGAHVIQTKVSKSDLRDLIINIDPERPAVNINEPSTEWKREEILNIQCSDAESGFKNMKYAVTQSLDKPSSGWINTDQSSISITLDSDGKYYIHIEAMDNAGNTRYICKGPYKIDNLRPQAPGTPITTPNPTIDNTQKWNWESARDDLSGIDYYEVSIDGGSWINIGNTTTYTTNFNTTGNHTLSVRAVDKAGNISGEATGTVRFAIAPNAPDLSHIDGTLYRTTTPLFEWVFEDSDPEDYQTAYQIQIKRAADNAIVYDTAKVISSETKFRLPTSERPDIYGPLRQSGTNHFKICIRVWDSFDMASNWAEAEFYISAIERLRIAEIVNAPSGQSEPDPSDESTHIVIKEGMTYDDLPRAKAGAKVTLLFDTVGDISSISAKFPYGSGKEAVIGLEPEAQLSIESLVNTWKVELWTDSNLEIVPDGMLVKAEIIGHDDTFGNTALSCPPFADGIFVTKGTIFEDWQVILQGSD